MAKFDPLATYLMRRGLREVVLTFQEIEGVIGERLPPYAESPDYWANTTNKEMRSVRRALVDTGYHSFLIAGSRQVRFERTDR